MNKKKYRKDLLILTFLIPIFLIAAGLYKLIFLKHFHQYIYCTADILGYYCPGCGGTRSVYALLNGDFIHSLWFHPVVPYSAFIYSGYLLTNWLEWFGVKHIKGWKFHNWYIYLGLFILGINFILKNILRICFGILM